jgi:hypothetical protein
MKLSLVIVVAIIFFLAIAADAKKKKPKPKPTIKLTDSPTTTQPTLRPTSKPINPNFVSPTRIPYSYPVQMELYNAEQVPNPYLCEILAPMLNSKTITWTNWKGDEEDCIKECTYDDGCMGIIYSSVLKTCAKSSLVHIMDSETEWAARFKQGYTYHTKKYYTLPYFASACAIYFKGSCPKDTSCRWNWGKQGYNQYGSVAQNGGYCGRLQCHSANKLLKKPKVMVQPKGKGRRRLSSALVDEYLSR